MKQPGLGKKVCELRLGMGMTQSELAEKCQVSLRTIQRIEAAEVTPRSYTVKAIFACLNHEVYAPAGATGSTTKKGGQVLAFVQDLFNLKTNTMKKATILSAVLFTVIFGITAVTSQAFGQSDAKVKKMIETHNENFTKWFNSGDVASMLAAYHDDACLEGRGCGKDVIRQQLTAEMKEFKIMEVKVQDVAVNNDIATEKGTWRAKMKSGIIVNGEYRAEWQRNGKNWLIKNESMSLGGVEE